MRQLEAERNSKLKLVNNTKQMESEFDALKEKLKEEEKKVNYFKK